MATQADGLTSSVPDPLSEVLGCGLDSGDDRRQAQAYAVQAAKSAVQADADAKSAGNAAVRAESWAAGGTGPEPERMRTTPNTMPGRPKPARQPQRQTGPPRKQPAKPP